ncbi:putative polysaccharide biosynthesis protein [Pseudoneobacillus sp. C159]
MKPNQRSKDWFKGAFILTIGALLTKLLSAIYRIPFQNMVGDIGFYIYQQVYPFYGLALVLSTYGFPVIISKHFTELQEEGRTDKAERFLAHSFFILAVLGMFSFLSLYFGAGFLAKQMKDPNLAILLKVISLVFLIFPIISVFRGYFQGIGYMVPTATSQVGEQLVRVVTILVVAVLFMKNDLSLYLVGSGAAFGSISGGIVAVFILMLFFLQEKRNIPIFRVWQRPVLADMKEAWKLLLFQGFAVCISGMLLIFIQLADSLNMLSLLINSGIAAETAKTLKGIYDRGQPLIQLGSIVATSMSLSLVPVISSVRIKADTTQLNEKIQLALQIGLMISMAATVGLMAIVKPTNIMLYENEVGSSVLAILTLIILLSSMAITVIAILQGLGVMYYPAAVIVIIFFIKYGLNLLLIPKLDSAGAATASVFSIAIGLLLLFWKLKKTIGTSLLTGKFLIRLLLAVTTMFLLVKASLVITTPIFKWVDSERLLAAIQALCGVAVGGLTFFIVVLRMNLIKAVDLALLPFGSKLLYLLFETKKESKK